MFCRFYSLVGFVFYIELVVDPLVYRLFIWKFAPFSVDHGPTVGQVRLPLFQLDCQVYFVLSEYVVQDFYSRGAVALGVSEDGEVVGRVDFGGVGAGGVSNKT